jgi:hypothetical protein
VAFVLTLDNRTVVRSAGLIGKVSEESSRMNALLDRGFMRAMTSSRSVSQLHAYPSMSFRCC